jgi:hypothetical protein
MKTNDYGEVLRVVGDMNTSSFAAPTFTNTRVVFESKIGAVTQLVAFLEDFGLMPPFQVAFGSWTGMGMMNLQKALSIGQLGPFSAFIDDFVIDLDVKVLAYSDEDGSSMELTFEITFKIPGGPGFFVVLGAVDFKMASTGNVWQLTLGGGYGFGGTIGPFDAYAYLAIAFHITVGDGAYALGGSALLKGDIDFVVAEAIVSAEIRGDIVTVHCGQDNSDKTVYHVGQVTIAVEITIFLVCDIEWSYHHEWPPQKIDTGPRPLPDIVT